MQLTLISSQIYFKINFYLQFHIKKKTSKYSKTSSRVLFLFLPILFGSNSRFFVSFHFDSASRLVWPRARALTGVEDASETHSRGLLSSLLDTH